MLCWRKSMPKTLTDDERLAALLRLKGDLPTFASLCLRVKDKAGKLVPFRFNQAQQYIHERLEEQKKKTGKVRALLLKGRQQGASTYCAARFYHQCTLSGKSALIVAHEDKATSNLFDMVKRYQEHNPAAPSTKASNAKELVFSALDSGYKLATAGTDDVGRGNTSQLIHASEFSFWRNPEKHMAGLGNTVADVEGTEIVMESTANGVGNLFHELWQAAEAGKGDYIAIFVPWFWTLEYWTTPASDFVRTQEEQALVDAYGLNDGQLQWRRNKITSYGEGFDWLFRQEYPCCASESFVTSTTNPLINPAFVMAAVNSSYRDLSGPLVIGVDPAGDGVNDADRTAIAFRRGRVVMRLEYHGGLNTMQIAGKVAQYAKDMDPAMVFVDKGGLGAGVYDRLVELGVRVTGVNSATAANEPDKYDNKRAEMWWRMRDWFADQPCRVPNNASLLSDLTGPQPKISSNGRRLLEKKEDMKKRGLRSPDGADALALTFAQPVLGSAAMDGVFVKGAATIAGY